VRGMSGGVGRAAKSGGIKFDPTLPTKDWVEEIWAHENYREWKGFIIE